MKAILYFLWMFLNTATSFHLALRPNKLQKVFNVFSVKGFGKALTEDMGGRLIDILPPSRPGTHRQLSGTFSRILQARCETFEKMQNEAKIKPFLFYDIYARNEGDETCWFVGKVSHYEDVNRDAALASVEILLTEYARTLRSIELGSFKAIGKKLQLLYALGNTEMAVAQNKIKLTPWSAPAGIAPASYSVIGYQPEIYMNGETGFRTRHDVDGNPLGAAFEVPLQQDIPNDIRTVDITKTINSDLRQ